MAAASTEFNHTDAAQLREMTAVVTGSSSGIGEAIARELAAAGAAVAIHGGSRRDKAQRVSDSIRHTGGESTVLMANLADSQQVQQLAEEAWLWRDGVQLWVNNAGADVLTGTAGDSTFEQKLAHLWQVDVLATIRLSRLIGQRMRQKDQSGHSAILNVGWDQADSGMAGDSGEMFAAAKGAVMAFTKSLAKSLAPEVRVNCLAPGWIKTAWGDTASEYWRHRAKQESLLGRWGTPQDVGRMARFLLSPAASFITGQTIAVNGGFRSAGE